MSYSEAQFAAYVSSPPAKIAKKPHVSEPQIVEMETPTPKQGSNEPIIESFTSSLNQYMKAAPTTSKSIELTLEDLIDKEVNVDDTMNRALHDWLTVTHHIMDYKYIGDLNTYVRDVQEDEKKRLGQQRDSIHNDIMITKRMYLMRQRNAEMLYSRVRILLHIMLFVSLVAVTYMNRGIFGYAALPLLAIMSFAFAIYVIMYIKVSGSRRYDDWNKMYWNGGEEIVTEDGGDSDALADGQCSEGSVSWD
nr:hypothetical protein TetV2_00035 [Oceanusvirus sp.]